MGSTPRTARLDSARDAAQGRGAAGALQRARRTPTVRPPANRPDVSLVVDVTLDQEVFDALTNSNNQQRLLTHEVADLFFHEVIELAPPRRGDDHFSVDAMLIEAWASLKSFKPKGTDQGPGSGYAWTDSKGEKRSNAMHESTTDSEAKLVRKGPGKEARLSFAGHATMENRNGLRVVRGASCRRRARIADRGRPEATIAQFQRLL